MTWDKLKRSNSCMSFIWYTTKPSCAVRDFHSYRLTVTAKSTITSWEDMCSNQLRFWPSLDRNTWKKENDHSNDQPPSPFHPQMKCRVFLNKYSVIIWIQFSAIRSSLTSIYKCYIEALHTAWGTISIFVKGQNSETVFSVDLGLARQLNVKRACIPSWRERLVFCAFLHKNDFVSSLSAREKITLNLLPFHGDRCHAILMNAIDLWSTCWTLNEQNGGDAKL